MGLPYMEGSETVFSFEEEQVLGNTDSLVKESGPGFLGLHPCSGVMSLFLFIPVLMFLN